VSRSLAVAAALTVPLLVGATPRLRTPDPAHPVGKWRITFANGVIETCDIRPDGTTDEAEPLRSPPGRWKEVNGSVVVTFDDDRLERWTRDGDRWRVEHWCPVTAYPGNPPVVGTAKRE
jgi:hypothetical protein